jgi:hypothetical protein
VVGTSNTTFALDHPGYGSAVRSAVTVGGTRSPWSVRVGFRAAPGQVITIAAATGGHVAAVERFAVTGARVG